MKFKIGDVVKTNAHFLQGPIHGHDFFIPHMVVQGYTNEFSNPNCDLLSYNLYDTEGILINKPLSNAVSLTVDIEKLKLVICSWFSEIEGKELQIGVFHEDSLTENLYEREEKVR